MLTLETTQHVPLTIVEGGTIRITGTRVSLDVVVRHYQRRESPEEIQEAFPTLKLADIYAVISYYLNHREEVEEYLRQQEIEAERIRQTIEAGTFHVERQGLRERLMARREAMQKPKQNGDQG
jgi:uncharacterized protein (DUF433 family)